MRDGWYLDASRKSCRQDRLGDLVAGLVSRKRTCRSKSPKAAPNGSFSEARRMATNITWKRLAFLGSNSSHRSLHASVPRPSGAERTFYKAMPLTSITITK